MQLTKTVKLVSIVILALVISLGSYTLFGVNQDEESKDMEVYFSYPLSSDAHDDTPENLIKSIISDLGDGDWMDIAMYSLTDRDIRLELKLAALNGVKLRLYLERTNIHEEEHGAPSLQEICKAGNVEIRVEEPPSYHMNHKFAVINGQLAITGSYNWTNNADERNWENLLLIRNEDIVKEYSNEFNYMWIVYSEKLMDCGG